MSQLYAQNDASIRMAWENRKENLQEETKGICLVTGEKKEIARIHRGIKGFRVLSQVARHWFPLMRLHSSHMARTKLQCSGWKSMQNLLIQLL